jgi:hypothetical protein
MRVHHMHYNYNLEHVNLGNQPLYILYAYCLLLNFFSSFFLKVLAELQLSEEKLAGNVDPVGLEHYGSLHSCHR